MHFSALPFELKEFILSLLPPEDLYHCLHVSQEWREVASSESIWKKTLAARKINLDNFVEDYTKEPSVCKLAVYWKRYATCCSAWSLNDSKQTLIPYETSEEMTCCRIFVHRNKMALISNKIQVFSFKNQSTYTKENIPLPFVPHAVTMNDNYIICNSGNILLIFCKEFTFKKYCALALPKNSPLLIQTEKLKSFIENKQKFGPYIKTEALINENLWISCLNDFQRSLKVMNLKTLLVTDTNIDARLLSVTKDQVIVSTHQCIYVLSLEGRLRSVLSLEPGFNSFRATNEYILTYMAAGGSVNTYNIDGKLIWTREESLNQFKLDSTRNMIYTCFGASNCKLSAFSLENGSLAWHSELPGINSSEIDDIFLVCNKFLIIDVYVDSPSPVFHFAFVFDLDNKTLLYKAVLQGYTMYVSDFLWVQKRQNDLIVNIY